MKSAQFIRSASAVAIISLFAGCSTWDNMVKTNQGTTVGAASGTESTARNTTNSGNNEIGTIATSPTYGGGTPKSA